MALLRWLERGARPALVVLWIGAGCGSESDDEAPLDAGARDAEVDAGADAEVDAEVPVSNGGCTGQLELCDIREADCQHSIAEEVGCLREREATMPPVLLISEEEYIELLNVPNTAMENVLVERWLGGLALFDLARAGTTEDDRNDAFASRISAVYNNQSKEIAIIDRGMPLDDFYAVTTLAHELVHAQQDAEHDLPAWQAEWSVTDDRMVAASSVIEGEAVHFQYMVGNALNGIESAGFDWDELYGRWHTEAYDYFDTSESAYETAILVAPYAFGGAFVTDAWLRGGQDAIEALWEQPPLSSYEVLFGDGEGLADAEAALHVAALPQISLSHRPINFQSLGAFMFRTFLKRHGASDETALRAAEMLGADVFAVMVHREDGSLVSTWRIQLLEGADTDWLDELELEGFTQLAARSQLTFIAGPPEVLDLAPAFRWDPVPPLP